VAKEEDEPILATFVNVATTILTLLAVPERLKKMSGRKCAVTFHD
jgi:hypothetical protein